MNKEEQAYLSLMQDVIYDGHESDDRTGVGTYSKFGETLKFSLYNGYVPMMTTKKIFFKGVVEELLFFLRGQTDTRILEAKGVNIWKGNTSREYLDSHGLKHYIEGEMGPMYGYTWRNFNGQDQIANAIHLIKTEPTSRRIMVTAYDPSLAHLTVLAPCHPFYQFNVEGKKLSCQFVMRSSDLFLGAPFNILSYAILTRIIAKTCGLEPGNLIYVGGNTHVYKSHVNQVNLQCSRIPYDFPRLQINKELYTIKDIEDLRFEDFELTGYKHHPSIQADMAI